MSDAVRSFHYAVEAEKIHADLFTEAKKAVDAGKDYELEYVSVCSVCGHTVKDGTPDKCPICGVGKEKFVEFRK